MYLRDRNQMAAVCETLLRKGVPSHPPTDFFFNQFPTKLAGRFLRERNHLSWQEDVMLKAMFAFSGTALTGLELTKIFYLDPPRRRLLCSLIHACGQSHDAVDRWLADNRDDPPAAKGGNLPEATLVGAANG